MGIPVNCEYFCSVKKNIESETVFDRNTVEFVTVAAEYCAFLEQQVQDKGRREILDVLDKLLPLLYLKSAMLSETEPQGLYLEETVTEPEYDDLRMLLEEKLGESDDYLEVFVEEMKYSDTPVRKCISEDLADIYQALKNFIHSFRTGLRDIMEESVAVCAEGFRTYWGQTLANTLRAVHAARYQQGDNDEELYD